MSKQILLLLALLAIRLLASPVLVQDFSDTAHFKAGMPAAPAVGDINTAGGLWQGLNGKDYQVVQSPAGTSPHGRSCAG